MRLNDEDIHIRKLFPTPVASYWLADSDSLNRELKARILARRDATPGVTHSNKGGWQSDGDFADWAGEAGRRLLDTARCLASSLTAMHLDGSGLVHFEQDWQYNVWANINRQGDSNVLHGHPGAFWSGVYWVEDGGRAADPAVDGDLEFQDPRGMLPSIYRPELRMRVEECLSAGYCTSEAASSGRMLMFPSWLLHRVRPYLGQGERISVAFNFGI